jgi:hypothetical protein
MLAKYSGWIRILFNNSIQKSRSESETIFFGEGVEEGPLILRTANRCKFLFVPQSGGDCLGGEVPEDDRLVHGAAGQNVLRARVPRQGQHSVLKERVA